MLDDGVKSLEATSLVTNNGTMIYQALTIGWLLLGYHCGIIKVKCSQLPILDDNVKSLEDDSSVTNDNTTTYQVFTIDWLVLEYHCGIIGTEYPQVSNVGCKCKIITR